MACIYHTSPILVYNSPRELSLRSILWCIHRAVFFGLLLFSSHLYFIELFLYELRNTFCVHYPREFLSNYMLIVEFKQFISHCWSILISSASTTLYSFELVTIVFYLRAYTTLFMKFILACIDHAIFYICACNPFVHQPRYIFAYFAFELAELVFKFISICYIS